MRAIYGSALILGATFWGGMASAATEATEVTPEEIVVTAQKRAENLQDVPIAISTVSGNSLASLSQYAPPRTYGIKFSADF